MESAPSPDTPSGPSICTREATLVAWAGEACTDCGHTSLAHPGPANPELVACVICRLLDLALFVGLDLQPWQLAIVDRLALVERQLAELQRPAS
jgi:hypothetical protein